MENKWNKGNKINYIGKISCNIKLFMILYVSMHYL